MIITPNPFTDPVVSSEINGIGYKLHSVLSKYKGLDVPSKLQLAQIRKDIKWIFKNGLYSIGSHSLDQGCKEVGISLSPELKIALVNSCNSRSDFIATSITNTTAIAFGLMHAALSKKNAIGKKRSKSDASYEGSRIFFEQRTRAWRLKSGVLKAWYTASDPCNLCIDNEDDGRIPIDQPFASGDLFAPAHLNCECLVSLIL